MMALVADDAVFNLSIVTLTGAAQIRGWAQQTVDQGITVESSNYQVDGNEVTWDAVLIFPDGTRQSSPTTATVEDGLITSFTAR